MGTDNFRNENVLSSRYQKLAITKSKLIIIKSFIIMIRFEFASFESKASIEALYIHFSYETSYGV